MRAEWTVLSLLKKEFRFCFGKMWSMSRSEKGWRLGLRWAGAAILCSAMYHVLLYLIRLSASTAADLACSVFSANGSPLVLCEAEAVCVHVLLVCGRYFIQPVRFPL